PPVTCGHEPPLVRMMRDSAPVQSRFWLLYWKRAVCVARIELPRQEIHAMMEFQIPKNPSVSAPDERYLELVRQVPLRPIHSEAALNRAIAMIDSLLDLAKRDADEEDYLDVLSDLVEKYEDEHDPMPPASGSEMLRFLIESQGTTQAKVAAETRIAESTLS